MFCVDARENSAKVCRGTGRDGRDRRRGADPQLLRAGGIRAEFAAAPPTLQSPGQEPASADLALEETTSGTNVSFQKGKESKKT